MSDRGLMLPILATFGALDIRTYWVMAAIGVISGFITVYFALAKEEKEKISRTLLFAFCIFLPFLLGARYGFILEQLMAKTPQINFSLIGPVSLWWGLVSATLCAFPFSVLFRVNVWETADFFAPALAIGGFFARLGCFFNGCCFGAACKPGFPFPVSMTSNSLAYEIYGPNAPLYPAQLVAALCWLLIFALLIFIRARRRFHGELILILAALYSLSNFFVEFIRWHEIQAMLSISQIWSLIILVISSMLYPLFILKKPFGEPKK